jgi:DNA-directed RNA polymerase subunit beta'
MRKLHRFATPEEATLAYEHGAIGLHDQIRVRIPRYMVDRTAAGDLPPEGNVVITTTVGRVIFNEALPLGEEGTENPYPPITFYNEVLDSKKLRQLVKDTYDLHGSERTAGIVNEIKRLGFHYATKAGVTISAMDIKTPPAKAAIILRGEGEVEAIDLQFRRGLITDDERYQKTVEVWTRITDEVTRATMSSFDKFHSVLMMSQSGARGSVQQIRQLAGMRGLMADPTGRIIDLPIKANFSEGLTVLEYFISTHGARKGLADTALRTADSGYLTRRLVDVAQDVIVRIEDCETTAGIWVDLEDEALKERVIDRYAGRIASQDVVIGGDTLVEMGAEISDQAARQIFAERARIPRVRVRSIMTCKAREGVCRLCYGRNLATGRLVEIGEAVGVIAAQSIGEPGTQLTMRTFHTGGVATGGSDITQGLPRVEELFEARVPKGKALISEVDGVVELIRTDAKALKVKVVARDVFDTSYAVGDRMVPVVEDAQGVPEGGEVVRGTDADGNSVSLRARYGGVARIGKGEVVIRTIEEESREYPVPASAQLMVRDGSEVLAGDRLTEGSISPQELLLVRGRDDVQNYLVREVQNVYRSQGVDINDKHIEVIVRQMMRKVRVENAGDSELLPGEIISQFEWEEANAKALSEGGEPAIAQTVLLGLIKAALNTASWLSAASFQETTRVLTEAAISGKVDRLRGLKENVIIGKLIPAGTGLDYYTKLREEAVRLYEYDDLGDMEAELDGDVDGEYRALSSSDGYAPEEAPTGSI